MATKKNRVEGAIQESIKEGSIVILENPTLEEIALLEKRGGKVSTVGLTSWYAGMDKEKMWSIKTIIRKNEGEK